MSTSRKPAWRNFAAVVLSAAALFLALRGVVWSSVWRIASGVEWSGVLAGTTCTCIGFILRSLRWRILLNARERLGAAKVFWINMAGCLGNNILPARAGEVVRTMLITRNSSLPAAYVFTTAISERLTDLISLVLLSCVALATVHPRPGWMVAAWPSMTALALLGILTMALLPFYRDRCISLISRLPLPAALKARLLVLTDEILLGLRAFHNRRRLAGFILLTAGVWLADVCATVIGAGALGLHVPFSVAMLLVAGLGFGAALPSTPGYVGIYQFIYVTVLGPFGVSRDGAMAFALFSQAMGYLLTLSLGWPGFCLSGGSGASGKLAIFRAGEITPPEIPAVQG